MKKVLNGRRYDTTTARECGKAWSDAPRNDFNFWEQTLYQKRTGEFFLYGEGGPMTKYATRVGDNTWGWGEMIEPLTPEAAREWAEKELDADEYEELFGAAVEDETKKVVTYSLPVKTIEKVKAISGQTGRNFSEVIVDAVERF